MSEAKEFSVSSNGDRWSLEVLDGDMTLIHKANEPSGGHETRTALAAFLEERAGKPEHAALLQVLGQSRDEIEDQLKPDETVKVRLLIGSLYEGEAYDPADHDAGGDFLTQVEAQLVAWAKLNDQEGNPRLNPAAAA